MPTMKERMQKILLIVEMPLGDPMTTEPIHARAWREFLAALEQDANKPPKGSRQIHEGSWLLPADGALPFLLAVAIAAKPHDLPYSTFLLPDGMVELTSTSQTSMNVAPSALDNFKSPPKR